MSFFGDLGKRFAGTDDYTKSITDSNNAQSAYLASGSDEKSDNTFLIVSTIGTLVVAGAITYFVLKRK